MSGITRMIYVDESMEEIHGGWMVFGWVECEPQAWRLALRQWLEFRKELYREFSIPPSTELHSTKFVNGRDRIATNASALDPAFIRDGDVLWKDLGREVGRRCLAHLASSSLLRVGAIYRTTDRRGQEFARDKYQLYTDLVKHWDLELAARNEFGIITVDGQDPHYIESHRELKLDTRHVLEDPALHDSRRSQWLQIADLVAYTALLSLNRHRHNEFGWDWYHDHLAGIDDRGGPTEL